MMFGHVGIWWIILAGLAFSQEDFPFDRSVIAHGIAKHHFSEGMQYLYSVMSSSLFYDDISVDGRRIAGEGRRYSIDGSAVEQFTVATKMLPKLDNNTVAVEFAAIQLKRAITSFHASNFIYPTLAALEHVNWLFSLQGKNDIIEDRPEQFPHDDSIKQQRHIIKDMIDQSAQLINLGAYQEAYRIYDHIIYDMGVQFFEVYFNLAILYVRQGNLLAAIDAYQQALAIHPLHTKSLLNLGTIYQQCAQFEMAVEVYQMIIFIRRVVDIVTGEQGYTFMSDFYVHARSNLALTLFQQRQYLEVSQYGYAVTIVFGLHWIIGVTTNDYRVGRVESVSRYFNCTR
jgi:tetratricopeptide (TPR) repeat protein